jgi:hypothetical protein
MLIEHILGDHVFNSMPYRVIRVFDGVENYFLNVFEFVTIFVVKSVTIKRFLAEQLNTEDYENLPTITYSSSPHVLSSVIKNIRIAFSEHRTWLDDIVNVTNEHIISLKSTIRMFPLPVWIFNILYIYRDRAIKGNVQVHGTLFGNCDCRYRRKVDEFVNSYDVFQLFGPDHVTPLFAFSFLFLFFNERVTTRFSDIIYTYIGMRFFAKYVQPNAYHLFPYCMNALVEYAGTHVGYVTDDLERNLPVGTLYTLRLMRIHDALSIEERWLDFLSEYEKLYPYWITLHMAKNRYNIDEFKQILNRLIEDGRTHMFILSYTRLVDASYRIFHTSGKFENMDTYSTYWRYVLINDAVIDEIINESDLYPFSVHDDESYEPFNTWQKQHSFISGYNSLRLISNTVYALELRWIYSICHDGIEHVHIVDHVLDHLHDNAYALEMFLLYGMYAVPFDHMSIELLDQLFTTNEYVRAWMLTILGCFRDYSYIEGIVDSTNWHSDTPVRFIKSNLGVIRWDTFIDDFRPRLIVENRIVKIVDNVVNNKQ